MKRGVEKGKGEDLSGKVLKSVEHWRNWKDTHIHLELCDWTVVRNRDEVGLVL